MSIRSELIKELELHRAQPLSGQKLAEKLNVSRNAVCKMIHTLQEEGYLIVSQPRLGYQLEEASDILSAEAIHCYLDQDITVATYALVDSTNQLLKRMALDGAQHLTLIAADEQSAGRGRRGRAFFSPAKKGLYMSMLFRLSQDLQDVSMITIYAAVALRRVLARLYAIEADIKWINDVYYQEKKLCGILCEAISDIESGQLEALIVGIGVNTNTTDFPPELENIAASLAGIQVNRNQLIACIAMELIQIQQEDAAQVLQEYKRHSWILGKPITWSRNQKTYEGFAKDINDKGNLVVETQGIIMTLNAGEVSVRKAIK